jgi:hypothetical protein
LLLNERPAGPIQRFTLLIYLQDQYCCGLDQKAIGQAGMQCFNRLPTCRLAVTLRTYLPLTLSLLVARVAADHINRALTANDFAVLTNALNAGADFHGGLAYCFPACFGESM